MFQMLRLTLQGVDQMNFQILGVYIFRGFIHRGKSIYSIRRCVVICQHRTGFAYITTTNTVTKHQYSLATTCVWDFVTVNIWHLSIILPMIHNLTSDQIILVDGNCQRIVIFKLLVTFLPRWGRTMNICIDRLGHLWFRYWLVAC